MDKRKTANLRVRTSIEKALFTLMGSYAFSDISVSQIITEAKVARVSYYRNYTSKQEIIERYWERLYNKAVTSIGNLYEIGANNADRKCLEENTEKILTCYLEEKNNILLLHEQGLSTIILETMNTIVGNRLGKMSCSSMDRYLIYFLAGATYNTLIHWLTSGAKEPPEKMANYFSELFDQLLILTDIKGTSKVTLNAHMHSEK